MKRREPSRFLAICGILLILASIAAFAIGSYGYHKQEEIAAALEEINAGVKANIYDSYQSDGFSVETTYGKSDGYQVYITLNHENNSFDNPSLCGCIGTDILSRVKEDENLDGQIAAYHFSFLITKQSDEGSSTFYTEKTFTADYDNRNTEESAYEVRLAMNEGTEKGVAKTYLQYLSAWATRSYTLSDNPTTLGNDYQMQIHEDGSYEILPVGEHALERNPLNALSWYMDEYTSQYFILSDIDEDIVTNQYGSWIRINFRYTNNIPTDTQRALIMCFVYNADGEVIARLGGFTPTLEPNESYDLSLSQTFKEEVPTEFRFVYVRYISESEPTLYHYIVME